MKLPLLLCVCMGLVSLPALAEQTPKPPSAQTAPERDYRGKHERKDKNADFRPERSPDNKIYRSKKLRIHKHGQGQGPYPSGNYPISDDE